MTADPRTDSIELAREKQLDEREQRNARAVEEEAWLRFPTVSLPADSAPEPLIVELSPEQTIDAIYRTAGEARLNLIFCPTIRGDLRKRWANRLGDINLQSATAAAEIDNGLQEELAICKRGLDDELDLDVMQISDGLWRLRWLCLRHQEFLRAARK
jgi:hypothetical protein